MKGAQETMQKIAVNETIHLHMWLTNKRQINEKNTHTSGSSRPKDETRYCY